MFGAHVKHHKQFFFLSYVRLIQGSFFPLLQAYTGILVWLYLRFMQGSLFWPYARLMQGSFVGPT